MEASHVVPVTMGSNAQGPADLSRSAILRKYSSVAC